jgi:hypothetical protein
MASHSEVTEITEIIEITEFAAKENCQWITLTRRPSSSFLPDRPSG